MRLAERNLTESRNVESDARTALENAEGPALTADQVEEAFAACGLEVRERLYDDDWVVLICR